MAIYVDITLICKLIMNYSFSRRSSSVDRVIRYGSGRSEFEPYYYVDNMTHFLNWFYIYCMLPGMSRYSTSVKIRQRTNTN